MLLTRAKGKLDKQFCARYILHIESFSCWWFSSPQTSFDYRFLRTSICIQSW